MSISYSGIVGRGKATLPSVEMYGTDMGILKDPPKMVMTRRIDKAQDTSLITELIDGSGDRIAEAIKVYPRGVNPMVAVNYSNSGNNGGNRMGGVETNAGSTFAGRQAYLPFRIDAVRMPIVPPQSLLPMSRLPRTYFTQTTQPSFVNWAEKPIKVINGESLRPVKKASDMIRASVRPTKVVNTSTSAKETYDIKYVIQNPIRVSAHSGVRTMNLTETYVGVPTKPIDRESALIYARTNASGEHTMNGENDIDASRYTHEDTLHGEEHYANASSNIHVTPVSEIFQTNEAIHENKIHATANAPKTSQAKINYLSTDMDLQRALPAHSTRSNVSDSRVFVRQEQQYQQPLTTNRPYTHGEANRGRNDLRVPDTISSRDPYMKPKVQPGGFDPRGTVPVEVNNYGVPTLNNSTKADRRDYILQLQQRR